MVEVRHPTSHFPPGSRVVFAGQGPAPEGLTERGKAHPGWFSHHRKAKQKAPRGWPTFHSCFPGGFLPHSSEQLHSQYSHSQERQPRSLQPSGRELQGITALMYQRRW